ncbi:MAG TPA: DUF4349 domain-containing protein [Armatimonadota bacterium]|nr:DUF4349 domain-containing protein [Armatimonadota bacterium]
MQQTPPPSPAAGGSYVTLYATRIAQAPEPGVPPTAPEGETGAGRAVSMASPAPGDDRVMRSVTLGETEPWRDLSGERQVSYQKQMEVEVRDVEQAHQQARQIVDRRGGYVASDRVRIEEDGLDSAEMVIRLPVYAYEDAIEDLRELGEVVRLVGESVDRTHEYYTQGAEVREMADREAELQRKYDAETNSRRKHELKRQLDALRAQMHAQKELLDRLSEETHWPLLELTLTESGGGPVGFLSRALENSVAALAWVGATAIVWLPAVVIVTLFWRRRLPPIAPPPAA